MTLRNRIAAAVLAGALIVSGAGYVQAQNKPDCPKGAVDIEGQVVRWMPRRVRSRCAA
jgi:hypothetical protein